ncbi:helix-turn-helix domain-containing protein [Devosia sp.]|uniref:helix-turn-helix domain-containing protein n=1 Tax=Devosia sp. TaxID=1871048 RepID=UPI001A0ED282|nr:helix-turn-helix domain-containing protein [Devosia sp.]MBE0577957.1 helix-turn-helix domain-containing protein [Devosia sp.]
MFEQIGAALERVLDKKQARVPVRKHSYRHGQREGGFWRKASRQEVRRILLAAKRYELTLRRRGRRCGPLGSVAIEVLEYLANLVDFRTGRLEPSIVTLMRRLKRSRDAIVRALKNLRTHGFLDWLRRYVPTGNEGRGPQVRQASNAYRLHLPERAKRYLGPSGLPEQLPEDCEHAQEVRHAELATYGKSTPLEELALSTHGDTPLGQSLAQLGRNVERHMRSQQRESARRAESESYSIKPSPD